MQTYLSSYFALSNSVCNILILTECVSIDPKVVNGLTWAELGCFGFPLFGIVRFSSISSVAFNIYFDERIAWIQIKIVDHGWHMCVLCQ